MCVHACMGVRGMHACVCVCVHACMGVQMVQSPLTFDWCCGHSCNEVEVQLLC